MEEAIILFMYVGNLEAYQGISLLLSSFVILIGHEPRARLAIVGGRPEDIKKYRAETEALGIASYVDFRGHQPVSRIASLLKEADVLVSPRIKGTNTPMKIYSYLDSGKPVLATDLFTHTQVLNPEVAMLAPPEPKPFAQAMRTLAANPELRAKLGANGHRLVREKYSSQAFKKDLGQLYKAVETKVSGRDRNK